MSEELEADREPRLRMFLEVLDAAGGRTSASEYDWNPINAFCEEYEKQSPDTFNLAINLGLAGSSHNSDTDEAVVWITDAGREFLARPTPHPIANAGEAMREEGDDCAHCGALDPSFIKGEDKVHPYRIICKECGIQTAHHGSFDAASASWRRRPATIRALPLPANAQAEGTTKVDGYSIAQLLGSALPVELDWQHIRIAGKVAAEILQMSHADAYRMVLVPEEPTEAEIQAGIDYALNGIRPIGFNVRDYVTGIRAAMIAASKGGE